MKLAETAAVDWTFLWKIIEAPLKLLGRLPYDRYLRYRIRRDIRAGSGRKIGILIARLDDDTPNNAHRATIYEAIRRELGAAVELTTWPEAQTLGDGHEYDIERRAHEKAQKLLQSKKCGLLISGRVKGQDKDKTVLSLRFTVAEAAGRDPGSYKLTKMFDLPAEFVSELGAAIAARVAMSAALAVHMSGNYLVPLSRTANVPPPRFPPLEVFGRRPPECAAPFVSGRHPKTFTIAEGILRRSERQLCARGLNRSRGRVLRQGGQLNPVTGWERPV